MTLRYIMLMQRQCLECGTDFPKDGKRQFCTVACRTAFQNRKRNKDRAERLGCDPLGATLPCRDCGANFIKKASLQVLCRSCAATSRKRRREAALLAAGSAPIGATIPCADCGIAFEKPASRVKRCAPCQGKAEIEKSRRWRDRNPDKRAETDREQGRKKRADPEWRERNREYTKNRCARIRKTARGGLDHRMSTAIRLSLVSSKRRRKWEDLVGYSVDDLKAHIERQFLRGMSWENMAEWHIDHIVPKSSFNYSSPEDAEFRACWALSNLRPMWARENQRKSAKRLFLI